MTQEVLNVQNRVTHGQYLVNVAARVSDSAKRWQAAREEPEAHPVPEGTPLIIRTEPGADLDFLRSSFSFEIVAEHVDGYVLVASEDIDLVRLTEVATRFQNGIPQSGTAAKIYELVEDNDDRAGRLARILSEELLAKWPTLGDDIEYVIDLSIACNGTTAVPNKRTQIEAETDENFAERLQKYHERMGTLPPGSPVTKPPKQRQAESDEHFQAFMAAYEARRREWWVEFDELLMEREDELTEWVDSYGGTIIEQTNESDFPDSFTMRVRLVGKGLKDIVFNHPHLFEATQVDRVAQIVAEVQPYDETQYPVLEPPDDDAPLIVIVDSGIQEEHPLINPAIRPDVSISFVPGEDGVADLVQPNGHGTRVAGATVYRQGFAPGNIKASFFLGNVRVLDAHNDLHESLVPKDYIASVVKHSLSFDPKPKLFNHSISSSEGFRTTCMSAWATSIDTVSYRHDLLFVQAAGNLTYSAPDLPERDINLHLSEGRSYPNYLLTQECRLGNPAQSFQALTVGSVSAGDWERGDHRGMAAEHHPSAFTTSGHGIWDCVKPDVVEIGGDLAVDSATPPRVLPHLQSSVELIRTTFEPGRLTQQDGFGTSFAAPRVTGLLAEIQKQLPHEPALLYRALVAASARWPQWAEAAEPKVNVLRLLGYGLPDEERALFSSDYRVTLTSHGLVEIGGTEAHIYRIPIPESLRQPSENSLIRLDVALSYVALPKRTRRNPRGYLSTWADWKSSCKGESYESFAARVVAELDGTTPRDGEVQIDWMLREQDDWGAIRGVSRNVGTLQKDWAIVSAHEMPQDLCIAVFGHKGWDKNSDDKAKYTLAVSIESLGSTLEVYSQIENALNVMLEVPATEVPVGSGK